MKLPIYQIDAFTTNRFEGNPAAVCPLKEWLPDELLQKIAEENNLSETVYFVRDNGVFHIRWFTPTIEIKLCGHATLASAYVIFNILGYTGTEITFQSKSGVLNVCKEDSWFVMNFPSTPPKIYIESVDLAKALGCEPISTLKSIDYMAVFENEKDVQSLAPNFKMLRGLDCRGIIATSKGEKTDFVSRFFSPNCGVDEDPVCGSAHCTLIPYWSDILNKTKLTARQISKRSGKLKCEFIGDRVLIAGQAVMYLEGTLNV